MMTIKRMSVAEFRRLGYLQEVNRLFLHPIGLALEVVVDTETGEEMFGEVWDYRDDPEGLRFGDNIIDSKVAERISRELADKYGNRMCSIGYVVQPIKGAAE